jgi:hypothetical protein
VGCDDGLARRAYLAVKGMMAVLFVDLLGWLVSAW